MDIVQRSMSLHVSDLYHERVRTVGFALDDKLSHDDCVVGSAAERADPPLGRCQAWRVNGKRLILCIPGRSCLQTSYVRPVTELRLCIAADIFVGLSFLQELLVLFIVTLVAEGDLSIVSSAMIKYICGYQSWTHQEHALVQAVRTRLTDQIIRRHLIILRPLVLDRQLPELFRSGKSSLEPVDSPGKIVL